MNERGNFEAAGVGLLIGAGVGAGLMYLFDPNRGNARRAKAEERAKSLYHKGSHAVATLVKHIEARTGGIAAEARRAIDTTPVDSAKLTARVRAKLGRLVRKPHAVRVEASGGKIVLSGEIDASEAGGVLAGLMTVSGVKDVENHLTLLEAGELTRGAGAIASVAGGLIAFAGLRAMKRAG